jgi:hypothetical protein
MPGGTKAINAKKTSQGTSVNQTKRAPALTVAGTQSQCSGVGGGGGGGGGCTGCEPNVPYITSLIEFVSILESLKTSIDKFFPSVGVGMSIDTQMTARGVMDVRHMARIQWIRNNRDREGRFDTTNARHIQLLKGEFLRMGVNWEIDAWLREWKPTPPPVAGGNTATGAPGAPTRSAVPVH